MPPLLRSEVRDRDQRPKSEDQRKRPYSPDDDGDEDSNMGHPFSSPEAFSHAFSCSSSSSSSPSTVAKRAKLYFSTNRAKLFATISAKV